MRTAAGGVPPPPSFEMERDEPPEKPPWRPDGLLKLLLVWLALTLLTGWLPAIRGAFDGATYEWGTSYFGRSFSGQGTSGDYWLPLAKAGFGVVLLFLGWRRPGGAFLPLAIAWQVLGLADATYSAITDPESYRFRGDTLGIDVSLAWVGPALYGLFLALTILWAVRRGAAARRAPAPTWSRRNTAWVACLAALLPIQFFLLRFGEPHGTGDKIGVLLTIAQWFLLGFAFRPVARRDEGPEALAVVAAAFRGSGVRRERADRAAEAIRSARGYRWVGIYDVGTEEIAAVGWSGAGEPAHPRFPATQGLCGSAAQSGRTVLVGDVRKDPRYLTTFGSTLSEIIVPVKQPGANRVVGLIDVESDRVNAFSPADQAFLERCADVLSGVWA